jgi:predicted nuclease of predicted toxin-antitoxin system
MCRGVSKGYDSRPGPSSRARTPTARAAFRYDSASSIADEPSKCAASQWLRVSGQHRVEPDAHCTRGMPSTTASVSTILIRHGTLSTPALPSVLAEVVTPTAPAVPLRNKMDGQPCIRGLRFPVVTVLRMVAAGMTRKRFSTSTPTWNPPTSQHPELRSRGPRRALLPDAAAYARFLVDKNLSPRVCPILAAGGHHATHVHDEGMAATDPQVLAAAAAGGHILITAGSGDFGRELALTRALAPSVILQRQLPAVVRAADVAALLLANLTDVVTSALDAGAFIVPTPIAVRVRHLRSAESDGRQAHIGAGRRQAQCDVAVCREASRELQSIHASAVQVAASVACKAAGRSRSLRLPTHS